MDDLIAWLRAQLDEDERKVAAMEREANRVQTAPIFQSHPPNWLAGVDIFVSPTRWQAEVEAKRRILDMVVPGNYYGGYGEAYLDVVRELAQPYAGRSGWREEWRAL